MSGYETAPLLNAQDPETHLVLKLLRLQVLTPLAVLVNIATFLICGLVVKPNLSDLSKAFPTLMTPNVVMISLLWLIIFALQIFYCAMLVVARKLETRETLANGVGLRLVFANWLMVVWAIVFTLKFFLASTIVLALMFLLVLWINISLIFHPTDASHPADFIAIHAPMRLFLLAIFLSALPQSVFISLDWLYSPDHPERDYDVRSWEAFGFIIGTNIIGLAWVMLRRDFVWAAGGVWTMISLMGKRPKSVPVFAATILIAVLYPLCWLVALAWHRLREKDKEGVIALPPDDLEAREELAQERLEENDPATEAWAATDRRE